MRKSQDRLDLSGGVNTLRKGIGSRYLYGVPDSGVPPPGTQNGMLFVSREGYADNPLFG